MQFEARIARVVDALVFQMDGADCGLAVWRKP